MEQSTGGGGVAEGGGEGVGEKEQKVAEKSTEEGGVAEGS